MGPTKNCQWILRLNRRVRRTVPRSLHRIRLKDREVSRRSRIPSAPYIKAVLVLVPRRVRLFGSSSALVSSARVSRILLVLFIASAVWFADPVGFDCVSFSSTPSLSYRKYYALVSWYVMIITKFASPDVVLPSGHLLSFAVSLCSALRI